MTPAKDLRYFGKYELIIGEHGFSLRDSETDELLVDASILDSYWPIELSWNIHTRNIYIDYFEDDGNIGRFGISEVKD